MSRAVAFYLENLGFAVDADRQRIAARYAKAEYWALVSGHSFEWCMDDVSSGRVDTKTGKKYGMWMCIMRDREGEMVNVLGGVDFGRGKEPWQSDYRRVVECELALDLFVNPKEESENAV